MNPAVATPLRAFDPGSFDLVLKGGRVIDPASGTDAILDVAISGGKIAAVAAGLPYRRARPRSTSGAPSSRPD